MIGTLRNYRWEVLTLSLAVLIALMFAAAKPAQATQPGNAGRVVFQSDRDGDNEIYTMNTDGSNLVKVTDNTYSDVEPSVSPGGRLIAFASNRDGDFEIYSQEQDGDDFKQLTSNSDPDRHPTWSPSGSGVTFQRNTNNIGEILMVNYDEPEGTVIGQDETTGANIFSSAMPITFNTVDDRRPSYAPDGRLAFDREVPATGSKQIVVFNENLELQNIIPESNGVAEWDPDWSPDGTKLLYTKGLGNAQNIYQMSPDGTNRVAIVATSNVAEWSGAYWPSTSAPTKIVYVRGNDVYKANVNGTSQVNIATNAGVEDHPEVKGTVGYKADLHETDIAVDDTAVPMTEDLTIEFGNQYGNENVAASFECQLDAGGWSACTSPKTYAGVSTAAHTVYVRAKNASGVVQTTPVSEFTFEAYDADLPSPSPSASATAAAADTSSGYKEDPSFLAPVFALIGNLFGGASIGDAPNANTTDTAASDYDHPEHMVIDDNWSFGSPRTTCWHYDRGEKHCDGPDHYKSKLDGYKCNTDCRVEANKGQYGCYGEVGTTNCAPSISKSCAYNQKGVGANDANGTDRHCAIDKTANRNPQGSHTGWNAESHCQTVGWRSNSGQPKCSKH